MGYSSRRMLAGGWVLALLCVASNLPAFGQGGSWRTAAPATVARYTAHAASLNGSIYVVGGQDFVQSLARVDSYDPSTDTWSSRRPMSVARGDVGVVAHDGRIYAVAGSADTVGSPMSIVESYDPTSDTWALRAPIPTARWGLRLASTGGLVYAIGGYDGAQLDLVDAYDPATNVWTPRSPLPQPRSGIAIGVVAGHIYVAGGYGTGGASAGLYAYDPATDHWSAKAPMSAPRYTAGSAVVDGLFYVIGGSEAGGAPSARVERYDPAVDQWTSIAAMPTARLELAVEAAADGIHVIGGVGSEGLVRTHEVFQSELMVAIDIKPGSAQNTINLASAGVVPVAILSRAGFDATQVDPETLSLAGASVRLIGKSGRYSCNAQDVNGDGRPDLVCHVETAQFMLQTGDSIAVLTATTRSGRQIRGEDSIRIVP